MGAWALAISKELLCVNGDGGASELDSMDAVLGALFFNAVDTSKLIHYPWLMYDACV